jgi:hypothetical protein
MNKMITFIFRWKVSLPTFINAMNGFVQGWLGTRELPTTDKGEIEMDSYEQYEQDWLDTMDRYDDPAIEDMEEVWGL